MRFRLPLLVAVATLLFASFAQAENCTSTIIDKAGVIQNPNVVLNAARPLINQGADVHVVTVGSVAQYGSSLLAVETYFETSCPNWTTNGTRKANLYVIMVAPNDRAKNIFFGSFYNGAFDVSPTYSQLANSYFKNRQWELGIANTLSSTSNRVIAFHQRNFSQQQQARVVTPPVRAYTPTPTYTTPAPTQTADSSGVSGFTIFLIVVLIGLLAAVILYFLFRQSQTTTTTTTVDDTGYGPRTSYTPAPRSYGAAAPSHTTVINNDNSGSGFVTGMLVGEALSRPNYQPPSPVYVEPTPYTAPTPSYTPDPTPVADAPDSTWEEPAQSDTSFEMPSDPPSSDFGSSGGDSGF
jgi:hypothetical protein